jgi:peptidoglycan/xylan/chitin deacetylase (PgdA/CDA1 family)
MTVALLSMDIEDWYHTTYLVGASRGDGQSMLDGVRRFAALLEEQDVTGTFFVLSDLADELAPVLRSLSDAGHEIACHGDDHSLPNRQTDQLFRQRLYKARLKLEDVVGVPVVGYRAPCFALDDSKLESLADMGFLYDASWINFRGHPLYGQMRLDGWAEVSPGIRQAPDGRLIEMEVSTYGWRGQRLPIAGGGAFRMVPWQITRHWLRSYLRSRHLYSFYIHPFECSGLPQRHLTIRAGYLARARFGIGRKQVPQRVRKLIWMLKNSGYGFSTHRDVAAAARMARAAAT